MSGTINIAGLTPVEDPAYRYKMPKIMAKVEGRGNGIKTVLVNIVDLGAALNREPAEICKFFGCELGSQTKYEADTDRAIVNGSHNAPDLQNHLSRYIESFVLCKNCRLPETYYKVKHEIISQKCNACGSVEPVEMTHKLTTFILAQHKKAKELAAASDKKDKKDKKKKASAEESTGEVKSEKPKKEKKEKSSTEELSEKKEKSKKKKKSEAEDSGEDSGTTALDEDESDCKATDEAIDRFKAWFIDHKGASIDIVLDELRQIQTMASLRPASRPIIFIGATFTEEALSSKEVESHLQVLKALAPKDIQQRHLIAAFEWFFGVRCPQLAKYFPIVLKQLFDQDVVDEDVFIKWGSDLTRNEFSADHSMISLDTLEQLKLSASPFLKWLEEAEEESDDEDEEEEEEN